MPSHAFVLIRFELSRNHPPHACPYLDDFEVLMKDHSVADSMYASLAVVVALLVAVQGIEAFHSSVNIDIDRKLIHSPMPELFPQLCCPILDRYPCLQLADSN